MLSVMVAGVFLRSTDNNRGWEWFHLHSGGAGVGIRRERKDEDKKFTTPASCQIVLEKAEDGDQRLNNLK